MRFIVISAGVVAIEGKPKEEAKIRTTCEAFGDYADIDFCVDESNEDMICIVGTYHKCTSIADIKEQWRYYKNSK